MFMKLLLLAFVWSTILSIGLNVNYKELLDIFKKPVLLINSLVVGLLIGPLLAFIINMIVPLSQETYVAFVLYGVIAGAPIGPKMVQMAKGDAKYSVLLLTMLNLSVIVFSPIIFSLFLSGDVSVDAMSIVKILVMLIVLPMAIGIGTKAKKEDLAKVLAPKMAKISTILLLLMTVLFTALNIKVLISFEFSQYLLFLGFVVISFALNYLLIFADKKTKLTVALTTLPKNFGPVLAIAATSFSDLTITPHLLVMTVFAMFLGIGVSKVVSNKAEKAE